MPTLFHRTRATSHSRRKPDNVFRILALGDSFTFGIGAAFEDSYLVQLETRLNERARSGPVVEIIKAGIPRYWPEPEAVLLERIGVSFDPDLILVAFLPNDVLDTIVGMDYLEVSEGFLLTREADRLGRPGLWLFLHSHVARIILQRLVAVDARRSALAAPDELEVADMYRPDGPLEGAWKQVELQYQRMTRIADSIESEIAFVHIPQANFAMETASYPAERVGDETRCDLHRYALPGIRSAAANETLYWARDGHCNAAGYRVIADEVFESLIAGDMVP